MRKLTLIILFLAVFANTAYAAWIWTPETGRWLNPKYSVKDTAKEQFEWAMRFYEAQDYKKAVKEFDKLVRFYPNSRYASKAQYYVGRSHENNQEYYHAFLAYQTALDVYPYIENREEIIKREYDIGILFFEGQKAKVLGVAVLPALDKAIEIFEKVVINELYGSYADKAQFKIGESYNKQALYAQSVMAFQRLIEEYPTSDLIEEARYEVAYATYRASLDPEYNQDATDDAIREFENFARRNSTNELAAEADKVLDTLREKRARSVFDIAAFYERQHHYASAAVYYKEVVDKYPNTSVAPEALSKYTEVEKKAKTIAEKEALKKARKFKLWR